MRQSARQSSRRSGATPPVYLRASHKPTFVGYFIQTSQKGAPNMSRLTIDVTEQQHQALKAMAALEGKTIKQYALERLFSPAIGEEQAAYQLKKLLTERLAEALRGELEQGSISDIADELLRANSTE
jgi:uncharacterized protein (DUF1778 family)